MMTIYNSIMHDSSLCRSIGTCTTVGAATTRTEGDLDSLLGDTSTPGRPSKEDGDRELSLEFTNG